MLSTCTRNEVSYIQFLEDLEELTTPMGEGAFSQAVSDLHDRFALLAEVDQRQIRTIVAGERFRQLIIFAA